MSAVTTQIADHIATIMIDRPPVNAVDRATYAELCAALYAVRDNPDVRVVILTAAGTRAFVAGVDVKSIDDRLLPSQAPVVALDRGQPIREVLMAIGECPMPVICAVNGVALGAGFGFASMCDIILACEGAEFGFPEINVGLLGGLAHLTMMVGRYRARSLYFTGERLSAEELHALGVVRKVVPSDRLLAEATELAKSIAAKSPIAVRLAKEAMTRIEGLPLMDAYRIEQDYTIRLNTFEDAAEARSAAAEKRPPDWRLR